MSYSWSYAIDLYRINIKLIHTFAACNLIRAYQQGIVKKTGTNLFYIKILA